MHPREAANCMTLQTLGEQVRKIGGVPLAARKTAWTLRRETPPGSPCLRPAVAALGQHHETCTGSSSAGVAVCRGQAWPCKPLTSSAVAFFNKSPVRGDREARRCCCCLPTNNCRGRHARCLDWDKIRRLSGGWGLSNPLPAFLHIQCELPHRRFGPATHAR